MTLARKHQIIPGQPGFYHCISRCVRRAWLCGRDPLTGRNYDHRRDWIIARMNLLSTCFAIDVYAYAIMSNHYHIVMQVDSAVIDGLSDTEVVIRWKTVWNWRNPDRPVKVPKEVAPDTVREWRKRLADVSWFMRMLNEPIARIANSEDDCTGHFWNGRFKSIPLLDEAAVVACMTYVDLNPVKAGIAKTPIECDYTSIQQRMTTASDIGLDRPLKPIQLKNRSTAHHQPAADLSLTTGAYIDLVCATAVELENHAGHFTHAAMTHLGIKASGWIESSTRFLEFFRSAAGGDHAFALFMEQTGRKRRRDAAGRRQLFSG